MLVSRNSIRSRREFLFFFFVTHGSLSPPNLSRKIEGPLLAGYKLININISKDRSFQQYLVLDILTNPVRVTLTKKVTFWGKIHCQSEAVYILLFED